MSKGKTLLLLRVNLRVLSMKKDLLRIHLPKVILKGINKILLTLI
jgi:hypothetical protein